MIKAAALWAALAAAALAAAPGPGPAGGRREKRMDWSGAHGGPAESGARVAADAKEWAALWKTLGAPAPRAPDFTRWTAVAAFAGSRPTGGWAIGFLPPEPAGDDLTIRWKVVAPPANAFTTQAFTQPWVVKLFPRPKGRVKVEALP